MKKAKAVGIDLGTTYSCVGIWQELQKRVEIITNEQGNRTTPSMVAFTPIESLVGQSAMNQVASNTGNTVFDTKRIIGKKFSDPSLQTDKTMWPFSVVSGAKGKPLIQVSFKNQTSTFTAEEISSMVLSRMKIMAENFLGEKVTKAVITVPAHFNNSQRQGTKDAGLLAGFEVMKLLNEPTAAAIAYGIDRICKQKENILVYDLGGGTFDVAVLSLEGKKSKDIEVKAVGGDTHLGGQDFDNRLVQHFVLEFKRKHDKDISTNPKSLRRLRNACERAKRELSWSMEAIVDVPCIFEGEDLSFTLTRAKFEQLNMDLFQKTISLVKTCLADSNMAAHEVNRVVLIGGSSRIPKVEQLLKELFQTSRKFHKQINPDEAVAYGAAIQAAILNGDCHGSLVAVRDVVPLSLGVGILGDIMSIIIPRNTPIPIKRERNFVTIKDFQTSARIIVYEGERAKASDNLLLGEFTIEGLPAALKGKESITESMHVDENGILTVITHCKCKAIVETLVIGDPFAGFAVGETEEMISTAQKHRLQDKAWKEVAVLRNELRDEIYNATKMLQAKRTNGSLALEYQDLEDLRGKYQTWVDQNSHPTKKEVQEKIANIKLSMKRCNEMRRKSSWIICFGKRM